MMRYVFALDFEEQIPEQYDNTLRNARIRDIMESLLLLFRVPYYLSGPLCESLEDIEALVEQK